MDLIYTIYSSFNAKYNTMKIYKFFLGCSAALAMVSCVSEDLTNSVGMEVGRLEIGVEALEPMKTRADVKTVTNFPVTIYEADGTTKVDSWDAVSAMPSKILLPVGNYVLEAHTPGIMERIMTSPYYKGTEPSEIQKDLTTQSTITCKQANTSVTVKYDPDSDFLDLFTSWTITFNDGNKNALSFTNKDGDEPATLYWDLGGGVEKLNVEFRGVNKDGTVSASMVLTKTQATETYDGQSTNFAGGDAIVVNVTPTEATSGYVTIGITANIFGLNAESVDATVEIVDNGIFPPDDGGGEDPNPGDNNAIVLTLPDPVTLSAEESATADPSSGDVIMTAEKGLKSVMVKVQSSSDEMMEQLAAVAARYEGVDLVNGCEVVGNQNLVAFLGGLDKEITVPAEGDTEYTFPVGQFYLFLGILTGEHNFVMTVKDMEGNQKTGTVVVTITE